MKLPYVAVEIDANRLTVQELKQLIAELQIELDSRAPQIVAAALANWPEYIRTHGTINAIKEYRAINGCGLLEATRYITKRIDVDSAREVQKDQS